MAKVAQEMDTLELLKDEVGGLMMEEGISTITFYKGDFRPAADALREQFTKVVVANPWLAGRLVKTKAGIRLSIPEDGAGAVAPLFTATSADESETTLGCKLSPTSKYVDLTNGMYKSKKVIVASGHEVVGEDKPLTLLTVAESAAGEFAVVFSMSHQIGDGRTYYEILKMLKPGAETRGLTYTRVMSFSQSMRDRCGGKEIDWSNTTWAQIMYSFAMMFNKKASCHAFYLDKEKLAAAKTAGAAEGGVPYVTTNDILTSGFFNKCKARIGMMGMDCRGKWDGMDADLAGNYVTALVLDDTVFGTPASLREMYATTPYKVTGRKLPTCCCGGEGNFAMISNWSSFAGDLVPLEGCEMLLHLPVLNTSYICWDQMIPFASGNGRIGVICWVVSTDEAGLREALPLGESVSEELFP